MAQPPGFQTLFEKSILSGFQQCFSVLRGEGGLGPGRDS